MRTNAARPLAPTVDTIATYKTALGYISEIFRLLKQLTKVDLYPVPFCAKLRPQNNVATDWINLNINWSVFTVISLLVAVTAGNTCISFWNIGTM